MDRKWYAEPLYGYKMIMWSAERVEALPALYICAPDVLLRYTELGSCET